MREEGDGGGVHDRDRGLGQAMGDRRGPRRLARARARRDRALTGAEGARCPYGTRSRLRGRSARALLAEHRLAVEALDGSAKGLAVVRETARARGISLGVRQGTADALPFDDRSFDFVLS